MEDDFDDVGIPDDDLTSEADLPEIDGGDEADIDLDVEAALVEPAGRPSGGARARMGSASREPQSAAAPVRPPAPKAAAKKPAVKKPAARVKAKAPKPKARAKAKAKKGAKKKAAPRKKAARGKGGRRAGARKGARKGRR
jgi:hypothetical protein